MPEFLWEFSESIDVTPDYSCSTSYLVQDQKTGAGGQFGWGGTPLKRYQRGPKFSSNGSEIRLRGQSQKLD